MMSGEIIYLILENCSHFINVPMQQSVYHFYIEIPFHTHPHTHTHTPTHAHTHTHTYTHTHTHTTHTHITTSPHSRLFFSVPLFLFFFSNSVALAPCPPLGSIPTAAVA